MAENNKRLLILGKNGGGSVGTQVQSDWAETNTESVSYIKNKPTISDAEIVIKQNNVTKGSFTLNQNGPATINLEGGSGGGSTQVQSDWAETNTESVSYIKNKPSLATVATSGSYSDLSGTPSLSNVATSGNYDDLLNKPTIPDAQVNSDWNAQSGISQILNKPNLSTVATSGSFNDLIDKPTIPDAQVNSDWNASSGISQILNKPTLSIVATSGNYDDLLNKPTIPDAQVNSDWNANSGISQILNKPNMTTQTLTFVDENNVETNVVVYTQPTA